MIAPWRTSTHERPFTWEGNYPVYLAEMLDWISYILQDFTQYKITLNNKIDDGLLCVGNI